MSSSSSSKKCCVPGCNETDKKLPLHLFPNPIKDMERFQMWILYIGADLVGADENHIYKHRRVCHAHFEQKYICRYGRLSNIAVPTLNLPGLGTNLISHRTFTAAAVPETAADRIIAMIGYLTGPLSCRTSTATAVSEATAVLINTKIGLSNDPKFCRTFIATAVWQN